MRAGSPPSRRIALTGTPGTGKSTVASLLPRRWRVSEVRDLAVTLGAGDRRGHLVVVDLPRLRRRLARSHPAGIEVLVGHLARLLPVEGVSVLRCHPRALGRRLSRARRASQKTRRANVIAEASDLVLLEALDRHIPVWEVDTTRRSPRAVAQVVVRLTRRWQPSRFGRVDWLADPWVTAHLLDRGT